MLPATKLSPTGVILKEEGRLMVYSKIENYLNEIYSSFYWISELESLFISIKNKIKI